MGMFAAAPFLDGELLRLHENACNWFYRLQGDGRQADRAGMIAPPGALPEHVRCEEDGSIQPHYKNDEHSGQAERYDFWLEGTLGGVIMKSDLLLVSRDRNELATYLPKLELALAWAASRQSAQYGLLATGPAGTFIERAYSGTAEADGTFSPGYLSGVQIYYCRALQNMVELERLAGNTAQAEIYARQRQKALDSLALLIEDGRYFINYLDGQGNRHGVLGAEKHNYFESNPNHDAIAFGVANPDLAENILATIAGIPGLRPTALLACVYPQRDDVLPGYQSDPAYGPGGGYHWNGAAWFSSQARLLLAYLRQEHHKDAAALLQRMLALHASGLLRDVCSDYGRLDDPGDSNPDAKNALYIDGFAVFAAALRGLFEFEYRADSLLLRPHLPASVQSFRLPTYARFGNKKIYLSCRRNTASGGNIAAVQINGQAYANFQDCVVTLDYAALPREADVSLILG